MATIFSHSLVGVTLAALAPAPLRNKKFYFWMALLPIVPDFDSIGFAFYIPYESFWGHRGITHSVLFSLIAALIVNTISFRKIVAFNFLFFATASHAFIDALTNGGLGVALYSPFSNERIFFGYRPIQVSPIGVHFFSKKGLEVLQNEFFWIVLPCIAILLLNYLRKKKYVTA
jgi:inner membrane protein